MNPKLGTSDYASSADISKLARMATKTIRVDDLDGSEGDVSALSFSVDGVQYSIDLNSKNQKKFRDAISPYVAAASRTGGPARRARGRRAAVVKPGKEVLTDIREWARAEGYEVSDRGRISAAIREAYDAAH